MQFLEFRFAFSARDFDQSVRFYTDLLGMEYLSGWDRAEGKGALVSAGGNTVVEIYGAPTVGSYTGPAPAAINLALRVANRTEVDGWHQKLEKAGADILEAPTDRAWGHRSFMVNDPDGIPIHIYCELE
jgi:catechol 2,3-dioxygenase-like lactoylglutathione lyase family enzyme